MLNWSALVLRCAREDLERQRGDEIRRIRKQSEPESFTEFRESGGSSRDWHRDPRDDARQAFRGEQLGLCAFCCCYLPDSDSLVRIAHVVPRMQDISLDLDWNNL